MRNPAFVAHYVVQNEIDYLGYSLETLYDSVDRLVIVENTNDCARQWANEQGLSTDGTTELLGSFPDPDNKIVYLPVGFLPSEGEARQICLDQTEPGSIIVMIDGDEAFYPEELSWVYETFLAHPEVDVITGQHIMFWGDLRHYVYDKNAMRRFLRYGKGLHFAPCCMGGGIGWTEEPEVYVPDSPPRMLHFGWVRQPRRMLQKVHFAYNYMRTNDPSPETYHIHGLEEDEIPGEIILNHPCFTRQVPPDWEIREFNDPLPEPFRAHPFAGMTEEEILDATESAALLEEIADVW